MEDNFLELKNLEEVSKRLKKNYISMTFHTPVLFLIYNRPDTTVLVFNQIKKVKPQQLFIAADGPKYGNGIDWEKCKETREVVINGIDWQCEVKTLFRENNLGCKIAVSSAITWFFDNINSGIILEDDTVPNLSFFVFCEELLEKYKDDENIYHISGNNFQLSAVGEGHYYLSKIPHVWGWASWRRAWIKYDAALDSFNEHENISYFHDSEIDLFWKNMFTMVKKNQMDTWDYQWSHAILSNQGYSLQPQYNLVRNVGFDSRSTRTTSMSDLSANLKTYTLRTIDHPTVLQYEREADINFQRFFGWYIPLYHKRISGAKALKSLISIISKRLFNYTLFEV